MLQSRCEARPVKECYLLANVLKAGPFDPQGFRDRLAAERSRIANLPADEIDHLISDMHRRRRYNGAMWQFSIVTLDTCSVWPCMGGRRWVAGRVSRVASELPKFGQSSDRLFAMAWATPLSFAEIPLIVFCRKESTTEYRIDDGCHRAVAYYLAGLRQAFAYVGSYDGPGKLTWPWEG